MSSQSTHIDKILRVAEQEEQITNFVVTQQDIDGYDTALKITHNKNVIVSNVDIVGGLENAVDCDDTINSYIYGKFGSNIPLGPEAQVLTFKGGCENVSASGIIRGEPGRQNSHIQIGQWMDQSYKINKNIFLNFKHEIPGKKINVVTGWVKPFSIKLNGDCKLLIWESFKLKSYIIVKFIVRFILRIPKGVKGPSWM